MAPSSSRRMTSLFRTGTVVALLAFAALSALGQPGVQAPPLYRDDADSRIEGAAVSAFLTTTGGFIAGDDALAMRYTYVCFDTYTGSSPNPAQNCVLGQASGTPSTSRLAHVHWQLRDATLNVNDPTNVTLSTTGLVLQGSNTETFSGSIPKTALDKLGEGDPIRWVVHVPLANPPAGASCAGPKCLDPLDTTGQVEYRAKVDRSTPQISLTQIPGALVEQTADGIWYIYAPNTDAGNPPGPIALSVTDNEKGAPLDQVRTSIYFDGTGSAQNVTNQFDDKEETPTAVLYSWDRDEEFPPGTVHFLHVDTRDAVGHRLDTRSGNPAVRIVIDTRAPKLDNETSNLKLALGEKGLAAKEELLRIGVNATDFATPAPNNFQTPKALLRVCATLVPANDAPYNLTTAERTAEVAKCVAAEEAAPDTAANITKGEYLRIPFDATRNHHYSEAMVVPSDWDVNGLVTARIIVIDPVGQAVFGNTWHEYGPANNLRSSNLTVDLLDPIIVEKEPLAGGKTSDFVATEQLRFRARITDPGDTDPWEGADTEDEDTDLLGIDQESVKVRYSIDGGNQVTSTLKAIAEENHFASNPITLAEEDTLRYFFEAKDLSGNDVRLPASGNHTVRVDRKGPIIEAAKFHDYLNGATHTLRFNITDAGIGIDTAQVNLFWRTPGTQYKTVAMSSSDGRLFTATIPGQSDGSTIEWYAEARDTFGNLGTLPLSTPATTPNRSIIDLVAPVTTIVAPDRVSNAKFNITWSAADGTGSGPDTYTIQFRVGQGGKWFSLVRDSRTTTFEVCADAQKTYFFRGSATDRAGNLEVLPDEPQTQTIVDATEACADPPRVTLTAPGAGDTIRGDYTIRWTASSQVAPDGLTYTIQLVRAGTAAETLTTINDPEAGTYVWKTASLDPADPCFEKGTYDLKVVARDPNDKIGSAEATNIELDNGIVDCTDRDADGLLDAWEVAQFGDLSQGPADDPDEDGHSNAAEFAAGSDPNDATSIPSRPGDGEPDDGTGWNNLYLLVVFAFLATLVVFVVGVSRRW